MRRFPIVLVRPCACRGAGRRAPTEVVDWMRAHAIPLLGVEAGHGAADLQPLAAALGEARLIGLGEASRSPRPPRLPLPCQPGPD